MNFQNIVDLFTYFIIYSFCGWVLESITKTVAQKKFVNSGFLYGPFCPIYGVGAGIMFLFLDCYKGHYILTFLISFFVFSLWEYFVGWLLEKVFHTKYWDYSYYKFHIKGRVCLVNSLTWGFLGIAFIEIIHPIISFGVNKVPFPIVCTFTATVLLIMLVDFVLTSIRVNNININLDKLNEITKNIRKKAEELKKLTEKTKAKESLYNLVEELNSKQLELKKLIEKQTQRFRKAFPSMTSEKINAFLSQKVEFRKIEGKEKKKK